MKKLLFLGIVLSSVSLFSSDATVASVEKGEETERLMIENNELQERLDITTSAYRQAIAVTPTTQMLISTQRDLIAMLKNTPQKPTSDNAGIIVNASIDNNGRVVRIMTTFATVLTVGTNAIGFISAYRALKKGT